MEQLQPTWILLLYRGSDKFPHLIAGHPTFLLHSFLQVGPGPFSQRPSTASVSQLTTPKAGRCDQFCASCIIAQFRVKVVGGSPGWQRGPWGDQPAPSVETAPWALHTPSQLWRVLWSRFWLTLPRPCSRPSG